MRLEWDAVKARDNLRKHNVSFEEAYTAFNDIDGTEIFDHAHSEYEDRYLLLGASSKYRLLVVSYCYRDDDLVRIISARKALSQERLNYLIR